MPCVHIWDQISTVEKQRWVVKATLFSLHRKLNEKCKNISTECCNLMWRCDKLSNIYDSKKTEAEAFIYKYSNKSIFITPQVVIVVNVKHIWFWSTTHLDIASSIHILIF
jgi:hypothetical protein